MNQAASESIPRAAGRTTRSTPSAPRPRLRSQSAATRRSPSSRRASASGSTTKSFCVPCPLRNSIPPIPTSLLPQRRQYLIGKVDRSRVEPLDPGVPAKPLPLFAHEPACGLCRLGGSRGKVSRPVDGGKHLLVTERAGSRGPPAKPTFEQSPHLCHQPCSEHALYPGIDTRVQLRRALIQPDQSHTVERRPRRGEIRGERPTGDLDHFQCPHHP